MSPHMRNNDVDNFLLSKLNFGLSSRWFDGKYLPPKHVFRTQRRWT
jgi:hypothetical protein